MNDHEQISSTEPTTERPHVSALLWDSILKTPFELRHEDVVKTRGRPRKDQKVETGTISHKMGDVEPQNRQLLQSTIHKIELDFKEYLQEGTTPKEALENICKLYRIPYGQAFNICSDVY